MKKLLSFALGLSVLVAVVLTGCSSSGSTESGSNSSTASQAQTSTPVDMNVTALKGPTAMGMVKFYERLVKKKQLQITTTIFLLLLPLMK